LGQSHSGDAPQWIAHMWTTRDIAARTLIWLAALAIPVQSLPAASCGCAIGLESGDQADCRCPEERDAGPICCASQARRPSCCSKKSSGPCRCTGAAVCRCGQDSACRSTSSCYSKSDSKHGCCCSEKGDGSCQCSLFCTCNVSDSQKLPLAEPLSPDQSSSEQLTASLSADAATGDVVSLPPVRPVASSQSDSIVATSLDRCISLSRFTL